MIFKITYSLFNLNEVIIHIVFTFNLNESSKMLPF